MSRIPCIYIIPCGIEKEAGGYIVYKRCEDCITISVRWSHLLAARGRRGERVIQTKILHVLHFKFRAAEGCNSVLVRRLSDGWRYQRSGLESSKGGGNA